MYKLIIKYGRSTPSFIYSLAHQLVSFHFVYLKSWLRSTHQIAIVNRHLIYVQVTLRITVGIVINSE